MAKRHRGKKSRGRGRADRPHRGLGKGSGRGLTERRAREHGGRREGRAGGRRHFGGPTRTLTASIDKNSKGFAYLIFDAADAEDLYLPHAEAAPFFHKDRVEATVLPSGDAVSLKLLEHRYREIVGRYTIAASDTRHSGGFVLYQKKNFRELIVVPRPLKGVSQGDWVRAALVFEKTGPYPYRAEIVERYGKELPASADVALIAGECGLSERHSEAAVREAQGLTLRIPEPDLDGRTDLRHVPFVTIDGETARDFDDAVHVQRTARGHALWVGIADVSHYVRPGTALDREARQRGTSVYFPERAFHMLPEALSENLCSLRPNEPRLAMAARLEYDRGGKRQSTELFEAVILSRRRCTYIEIERERVASESRHDWEFKPHFELYQTLRKARTRRGSIDFDLPETVVEVDPGGEPLAIRKGERFDSHRLIEEFMIAANEAVTEWIMARGSPFIYRIHERPSPQALERFEKLARTAGVAVSLSEGTASPAVIADVVQRLEGHPAALMLNTALLRSMKQAIYSATHDIHFGLASKAYTHFTSPIRRYPDLVVHRRLREALKGEQGGDRRKVEEDLHRAAEHCSYRERLATEAERESQKLKQTRFMLKHLGDEFDATVIGMIEKGIFVQLASPFVEGMVAKEAIGDDFYLFNEEKMLFYGRRSRKTLRIGQAVRVRCLRSDLERRQIDFAVVPNS